MIITDTEARQGAFAPVQQVREPDLPDPGLGDLLGSALRAQNTASSAGAAVSARMDRIQARVRARAFGEADDPGFDPLNNLTGYERYARAFVDAESPLEVESIKRRINRERQDRRILDSGGAAGVAAQVAAGVVDPLNFLPVGGTALRSARLGEEMLTSALRTGRAGLVVSTATEAGLHATQETRTRTESALAIGAGTFLSGVLGAAAPGARALIERTAPRVQTELRLVPSDRPDPLVTPQQIPLETTGTAGAMRVHEIEAKLKSALGVDRIVSQASPIMRALHSPSDSVRRTAVELTETPFYLTDNVQGVASPIAVETRVKFWQAPLAEALEDLDRLYVQYRQSGRLHVNDDGTRVRLTRAEFKDEVGKAMRQLDEHGLIEVAAAARSFREKVFDPLKSQAIKVRLLPEDVQAKGAPSYFSRVYNVQKIAAERPKFVQRLTDWLQNDEYAKLDEARVANRTAERIGDPRMQRSETMVDKLELREAAEEITDHILGVADGRIAYESVQLARGPLKERVLDVPDYLIEDFLESNVELIAKFYTRTMAPDVEITRAFGSVDMAERIGQVRDSYKDLIARAESESARAKLSKQRDHDIRDLAAMRDRLRGTFAAPADPHGFFVRTGQTLRNWNYLSLMGSMVVSSIPDLARPVMVHGMLNVIRDGILPLVTNFRGFKMAANEAKIAGAALDMVLNSRAMDLADIGNVYGRHSTFERGLQAVADRFGTWALMNPWNAGLKQFSSVVLQHNVLRTAAKGEAMTAKELEQLAFSGIDAEMAGRVAQQFEQHGERGTVWIANTRQWTDREAVKHFRAAIVKDVDRTIVTPGVGDRPLWASSEMGKVISRFHSFAFASVQRVLVSGLQQRDMAVLNGAMLAVGLGMGVYALHGKGEKKDLSDDPAVWIREGVDRSGITGWLYEAGNILEKFTHGTIGPRALTGGEVALRYVERGVIGALFGPSVGRIEDAHKVIGSLATGDFSTTDVRALRRLIPFQNLFYLRWLFDQAQEGVANTIAK